MQPQVTVAVVWLTLAGSGARAADLDAGLLGQELADLSGSGLFRWFHLAETDRERAADRLEVRFRPSGERFHDWAVLTVGLAGTGDRARADWLELAVERAFLEHPADGILARDLIKSVILAGVPRDDRPGVTALVDEIQWRRDLLPAPPLLTGQDPPKLPIRPSPGFLAIAGQSAEFRQRLPNSVLTIANTRRHASAWCVLTIRSQDRDR